MNRGVMLIVAAATVAGWASAAKADDNLMPSIVHEPCIEYARGKPFVIRARFEDDSQLFDPKVMYRVKPNVHWLQAPFLKEEQGEAFQAVIKAKELTGPLEYFIEVFDEYGNGPARLGRPDAPIPVDPSDNPAPCSQLPTSASVLNLADSSGHGGGGVIGPGGGLVGPGGIGPGGGGFPPPPQPAADPCDQKDRPLYCEAWFWATVGGVVLLGAGFATYLFWPEESSPNPEPSTARMSVIGGDPTEGALRLGGGAP